MKIKTGLKRLVMAACFCAGPILAHPAPAATTTTTTATATTAAAPAAAPAAMSTGLGTPVPAQIKPADWDQRLVLAREMHEIRPTRLQVEAAVDHIAERIPAADRDSFKSKIMAAIDEKKLEEVFINAMAQTFTVAELQRMIEYFSTPEARSIADKMPIYQQLVQPSIIQMLDKAVMEARTGGAGESVPAPTAPATPATPAVPQAALPHSAPPAQ